MSQNNVSETTVPQFLSPEIAPQGVEVREHEDPPAYAACMMTESPEGCDGLAPPGQNLCKNCAHR